MKKLILVLILLAILVSPVLAEPNHLEKIGQIPAGTIKSLIVNDTLYNQEGFEVRTYNISPSVVSSLSPGSYLSKYAADQEIRGMYIKGNYLYLVDFTHLTILNITNRNYPTLEGRSPEMWTQAHDVVVSDEDYAYVGGQNGLYIYDVSNKSNPQYLTLAWAPIALPTWCLAYDPTGYIYSGYGTTGYGGATNTLTYWNISDPIYPTIINSNTRIYGYQQMTSDLEYWNNTLYAVTYHSDMWAFNVTNRTATGDSQYISNEGSDYSFGLTLFTEGNNAYLYKSIVKDGIRIYNLQLNASHKPIAIGGQYDSMGYTRYISTNGNITVVNRWTGGIRVINTVSKTQPFRIIDVAILGEPFDLGVSTHGSIDILGAVRRNYGIMFWNVTDPSDIINVANYSLIGYNAPANSRSYNYAVSGNYSYYTGGSNTAGVYIVNMTKINTPEYLANDLPYGRVLTTIKYMSVAAHDNHLFTTDNDGNIRFYNISIKNNPILTYFGYGWGNYQMNGQEFLPMHYNGTYENLYLTTRAGLPAVINMTNESLPKITSAVRYSTNISSPNYLKGVKHWFGLHYTYDPISKMAYFTDRPGNDYVLYQVDMSNLSDIHEMVEPSASVVLVGQGVFHITCNGTDVFTAGSLNPNLYMYDMSIPLKPIKMGWGSTVSGMAETVTYYNGKVYTASANDITYWNYTPSTTRVPISPNVDFSYIPQSGVKPLTVQFTNFTTDTGGAINSIFWNFDDGITSTISNPSHTFTADGTFHVNLTVVGSESTNSTEHTVTVGIVDSDFYADVTNGTYNATQPLTVDFISRAVGADTYEWNVTDGGAGVDATTRNFSYTYTAPGVYTVRYKVTDSGTAETATKTRSSYITVGGGADNTHSHFNSYYASPYRGGQNSTFPNLRLSTTSTNTISDYNYLQVGLSSNGYSGMYDELYRVRLYTFTSSIAAAGGYNVTSAYYTLYGNTANGGLGTLKTTMVYTNPTTTGSYVSTDWDATNFTPISDGNKTFPGLHGMVTYTLNTLGISTINISGTTNAMILSDYDAFNLTPTWSANLNSWFTQSSPTYSGGTYRPVLTVYYDKIAYQNAPVPVADISANTTYGDNPLAVKFYSAGTGNPTSYCWTFSVGNYSSEAYPEFTFDQSTDYNVSLTVTNAAGSSTAYKKIEVEEPVIVTPPTAIFVCIPLIGYPPLSISCEDQSINHPDNWTWTFGDGNVSTIQHANNTFVEVGLYNVSLKVMNAGGEDTLTTSDDYINVTYIDSPVSSFYADPTNGYYPLFVQFYDTSTYPVSWLWNLGDGNTSTEQNPNNTYYIPGSYTVNLTVTNPAGSNTSVENIFVIDVQHQPTVANFTINGKDPQDIFTILFPGRILIADNSTESPHAIEVDWMDGIQESANITGSTTELNLTHQYKKRGIFNISYLVYNDEGTNLSYQKIRVMGYQGMERVMEPECMISSSRQLTVTEYEKEMCTLCGEC